MTDVTAPLQLSAAARAEVERQRDRYPSPRSAILPSLWAVQEQFGWVPPQGMAEVASILGLAPSEVEAVSTFYSMYFQRPPGQHHILVCVNAACALRGADETAEYLERKLGCPSGSTTADGRFTWASTIECLGGCGYAPMMQIDHHFHENLTPEKIDRILEEVAGRPAPHGTPPSPGAEGPAAGAVTPRRRTRRSPAPTDADQNP